MKISFDVQVHVHLPGCGPAAITELLEGQKRIMSNVADFKADVAKLVAAVAANTAAINAIADLVKTDTTTIADLNKQIADLKAANPALDLTAFESAVAALSANNTTATGIVDPNSDLSGDGAPPDQAIVGLDGGDAPAPPSGPPEN